LQKNFHCAALYFAEAAGFCTLPKSLEGIVAKKANLKEVVFIFQVKILKTSCICFNNKV